MVTRTACTVTVCAGMRWGNGGRASKLPMLGVRAGAQPGCDGRRGMAVPCHLLLAPATNGDSLGCVAARSAGCNTGVIHSVGPQGARALRVSTAACQRPASITGHRHLQGEGWMGTHVWTRWQPCSVTPYLLCRALGRQLLHAALQQGSRAAGCMRCALQPCHTATRPAAQPQHGPAAVTQHSHRGVEAAACTEMGCGSSTQGCPHRAPRPKGP